VKSVAPKIWTLAEIKIPPQGAVYYYDQATKTEYALVADYFMPFNDPRWADGGLLGKQIGGKIGIVQDPFGKKGAPKFLGATTPIVGGAIDILSLGSDGKTLLAKVWLDEATETGSRMYYSLLKWNVESLIKAAIANTDQTIPVDLIKNGSTYTPKPGVQPQKFDGALPTDNINNGTGFGVIYGISSGKQLNVINTAPVRYGDIGRLDLLAIIKASDSKFADITLKDVDNFDLSDASESGLKVVRGLQADGAAGGEIVSLWRPEIYDTTDATAQASDQLFSINGMLYVAPNITGAMLNDLRAGKRISDGNTGSFSVSVTIRGERHTFKVITSFTDFGDAAERVFFGDRDLKNPGYSAFTLSGEVKANSTANNPLDVYRVEQRLKYLAFPAMGFGITNYPTLTTPDITNNYLREFEVDGSFGLEETRAVQLFQRVINGNPNGRLITGLADGVISLNGTAAGWLNAYNAPHWMDLGAQMQNGSIPGWNNLQNDSQGDHKDVERYGTSWTRDLMRAKSFALDAFLANIPGSGSRFRGAVDANYGTTLTSHSSHGAGMNFDLSINVSYLTGVFLTSAAVAGSAIDTNVSVSPPTNTMWSNAYALALNNPVGPNGPRVVLPNTRIDKDNLNYQINALYDFLSLYSVTRNNGITELNGWDDLPIANGDPVQKEAIRKALFGDGTASGGLIKSVAVGGTGTQNPLTRMGDVLRALGVPPNVSPKGVAAYNIPDHHNHFHLNIKPPTNAPVAIVASNNLLAAEATMADSEPTLLAAAPVAAQEKYDAIYSVCNNMVPVDHKDFSLANGVGGGSGALDYFMVKRGQQEFDTKSWKIMLLDGPKHGKLVPDIQDGGYMYYPEAGYLGIDQMTFVVEAQGKKFKEIYSVHVGNMAPEYGPCPDYGVKELSNPAKGGGKGSFLNIIELPTDGLVDAESLAKIHAMVSFSLGAGLLGEGGLVNFADLPAGAIGQTTGAGGNATITLDLNAAGHGWFIDTTPGSNEEYLPTSNPNEWQARAGSDAAGKMDMLSVLLHEYGHALGIEHSADQHAAMATTLTPGTRRLPNADELALMAQLVGTLLPLPPGEGWGEGATGGSPDAPAPFPTLPLGGGFGLAYLARLRGSRFGGVSIAPDYSTLVTLPHPNPLPEGEGANGVRGAAQTLYAVAANATLTNPEFAASAGPGGAGGAGDIVVGWNTSGNVAFNSDGAVGAATLTETASAHTRLNQVFALGANDRFLRFTLDNIALDDVNAAPDDAFEVALLDANTGLSLFGSTGLTRTDAFLNLQADGTERLSANVSSTRNADGSRTYLVRE